MRIYLDACCLQRPFDVTMTTTIRPLSEINRKVTDILLREMGVTDTLRFLSQFSAGSGDYTKEREQWSGNLSLEQITAEIKAKRGTRPEAK